MASSSRNYALIVFIAAFAVVAPSIYAHIGDFDDYWQKRAAVAWNASLEAYHPFPGEITNHLNLHVNLALGGSNSTRRLLKRHSGPCKATNPIDRCWRCDPNWDRNRKKLADCVLGFGRRTRGGKFGEYYVVTDPSDNDMVHPKPGTLRHAVTRKRPLWIIFARSMQIRLSQELLMTSDKTIDGRGANVLITGGAGIMLQFVRNVIIHGIRIHHIHRGTGGLIIDSEDHFGIRTPSDGDCISIFGSTDIWIDHNSMSRAYDGLVDAIEGSTGITVSNNHMTNHDEVMLFGAHDKYRRDRKMQVTVAFNHFGKGLVQRMPRCRWGFFHVVNNDYTHWLKYAIGGSMHPTIVSQGNRFRAPPVVDPKNNSTQVTKREYAPESVWKHWLWTSENDMFMNGAFFVPSGDPNAKPWFSKADVISQKPAEFVTRLTRYAGALNCIIGRPC